jgi:hypothetical protein
MFGFNDLLIVSSQSKFSLRSLYDHNILELTTGQGSFFWLQKTEGLTLVGVFMEGTTLTC